MDELALRQPEQGDRSLGLYRNINRVNAGARARLIRGSVPCSILGPNVCQLVEEHTAPVVAGSIGFKARTAVAFELVEQGLGSPIFGAEQVRAHYSFVSAVDGPDDLRIDDGIVDHVVGVSVHLGSP